MEDVIRIGLLVLALACVAFAVGFCIAVLFDGE